jgi:diacylglycerol kinase family enzyme
VDEAARLGIETHLFEPGEDPAELSKAAVDEGASALGAAGGDGTLGAVAGVAIEAGLPFVSVPFGTRNHFARDVGFDLDDPLAALAAFGGGRELKVDAARVGERVFVNNVSLGVYAQLVHDPAHQTKNRLVALGRLFTAAFGRTRRRLDVVFEADGTQERHDVVVMLVSNNAYGLEPGEGFGRRERLDEGLLYAYVVEAETRWALVKLLFRAVLGRVETGAGWTEYSAPSFRVSSPRRRLHAAVDGEAVVLDQELEFEILPCALRVLIPTGSRDQVDDPSRRP